MRGRVLGGAIFNVGRQAGTTRGTQMNKHTNRIRASWRRMLPVVAIGVGMTIVVSSPAEATIFERFEYADTFEAAFPICGVDVDYTDEFSGKGHIREGKGKQAGAFFVQDNFSGVETFTNPDNGNFFTISHNGIYKNIKATLVEGNVFEFVDHEAGQPFVLRDMDGNVLVRDRGLISTTYLFDTGGDDVPGGDFIELLDVRVSGPHPAFFVEPGEECPLVRDLLLS